jgi:hypothetical protein
LLKINNMAREVSPNSVGVKVSNMKVNEVLSFTNPYTSVTVMVSMLKRKEEHKEKIFKIRTLNNITNVTRIK